VEGPEGDHIRKSGLEEGRQMVSNGRCRIVAVVAFILARSASGLTQGSTTGTIAGSLTDSTGGVLQGVTVTLAGPHLQGVRTTTTDSEGSYLFRNLPPGTDYTLTATLSSFRDATREAIQVFLGVEGTINLTMSLTSAAETVNVVATVPLVDVSQTSTGVNITATLFETLPSARGFQQLTAIAPSVSLEMGDHDGRFENSPTVGASSPPENNYVIDGLSVTDPRYGISGANLTMNFVQEVQVLTGGYQAEFGRATGGVFNVVTKSGGNDFHGDLFNYNRHKSWTPDRKERRRNRELVTLADRATSYDVGGSLGGPIVPDKLWFFGAFSPIHRTVDVGRQFEAGRPVTNVSREYDRESNVYAGKVTWAPAVSHTLVVSAFGDPSSRIGWLAGSTTDNNSPNADETSALRDERSGGHNVGVKYTAVLSPTWLLDAAGGLHTQRARTQASTDAGRSIPRQIDETLEQFEHGGFERLQNDWARRLALAAKLTKAWGHHEWRYGADIEVNTYHADLHETFDRYFGPAFGFGTSIQEFDYTVAGEGSTASIAYFLQDGWKVTPSLQFNLGLRYEEQWLDSAHDVPVGGKSDPDIDICVVDRQCRTVGRLKLRNNWAPRLGASWDPMANGRSKLFGFWGRFYEAIPLDVNVRSINGERVITRHWINASTLTQSDWFNPTGSPLAINGPWTLLRTTAITAITPVDEDLKSQYEDQFILGGEYQFRPAWSVGVRFIARDLRRIIEDIGTFTNPHDPIELTGYIIGNPGQGFFGGHFDKPRRQYRAVEFMLQRAFTANWHLNTSFFHSRSRGNHEGLYLSGYDQLAPNITAQYDIPSFLANSTGKLRSDKPYQFKAYGAYSFPWGLTLSEGLLVSAGAPISAKGPEIVNGYGDGTIFLQPRGSQGRTETYWNLDFHADYRMPFARLNSSRHLSVVLDVFNLFNRHDVLEVDQDYVYEVMEGFEAWHDAPNLDAFGNPRFNASLPRSPYYATPTLFQSPRSMQIGLKFTF